MTHSNFQFDYIMYYQTQKMKDQSVKKSIKSVSKETYKIFVEQQNPIKINKNSTYIEVNQKPNFDQYICNKYNYCMESKVCHIKNQSQKQAQVNFQIPFQILIVQSAKNMQIHPTNPYITDTYHTDIIVENNLTQHKQKNQNQIQKKKMQKNKVEENLRKLNDISKEIIQKVPKLEIDFTKISKWGHSIYNQQKKHKLVDNLKENIQKKDNKLKQNSNNENTSINKNQVKQLKPINERIRQYKEQKISNELKHKQNTACHHKSIDQQKNIKQTQSKIQKNAKVLLQQLAKKKKEQQFQAKALKAKIRALQIHSLMSLKKCKKKPIDPTKQFLVEIPQIQRKNKQIKSTIQYKNKDEYKNEQYKRINKNNKKNFHNRSKNQKSADHIKHTANNTRKISQNKSQQLQIIQSDIRQNQKQMQYRVGKFYIWDIPIQPEDYQELETNLNQQIKSKSIKKKTSFRKEVDNFLEEKIHNQMRQYNKQAKVSDINQMIQLKKQRLIQQFRSESKSLKNADQVFWSEDHLFKLHPISNF